MNDALLLSDDDLELLSADQLRRYRNTLVGLEGIRYSPHIPFKQQKRFLELTELEALYGGAAGGGKSDALLMAALQYVHVPGYAALILRRTRRDLAQEGGLMDRAKDWFQGTDAHWNGIDHRWEFKCPGGGTATITFGYCEAEDDKYHYQGGEYQFIGFDELTQFSETQYTYIAFSRARRTRNLDVPLRIRAGTNPGGRGHAWVRRRFINPGNPARPFVPSLAADNPHLDVEEYMSSLQELDTITRAQLAKGDWDIRPEGLLFKTSWFTEPIDGRPRIIPYDLVPSGVTPVRFWDLAATELKPGTDPDFTAGLKLARSREGLYYVMEVVRFRGSDLEVERTARMTAGRDGVGVPIRAEQEGGASGKMVMGDWRRRVLDGYDFRGERPPASKYERAKPVSSRAEAGDLYIVEGPWNEDFLDELTTFPFGEHDDQIDALSGAYAYLSGTASSFELAAPASDMVRASPWRLA